MPSRSRDGMNPGALDGRASRKGAGSTEGLKGAGRHCERILDLDEGQKELSDRGGYARRASPHVSNYTSKMLTQREEGCSGILLLLF